MGEPIVPRYLPGEKDAIDAVVRAGETYGYGNLIHHLKLAWERKLIADGVGPTGAAYGSTLVCAWCGVDDRTGKPYKEANRD